MSFISYAQNYEDVLLYRALKGVDKGIYIDVGANDPVVDSVTKAFYDRGWRGINIEPVRDWYDKLQHERPEDINLQLAVGFCESDLRFYEVIGTGLSTMDESIAKRHVQEYGFELDSYIVPVSRLDSICEQYIKSDIHFLKIDADGYEEQIIKGNDWFLVRPWIVVIEATEPMTFKENYETWEPILLNSKYLHAYSDGLNRFYISEEHKELLSAFKYPPNVFDNFIQHNQVVAENKSQQALAEAQQAEARAQQAESKAKQAEANAQQAEANAQQAETRAQQAEARAQQAEARAQQAETRAQQAETRAQQAETSTQQAEAKAQQTDAKLLETETKAHIAENEASEAKAEIAAIYRTRSWRYTKPMRDAVNQFRNLVKYFRE